MDRPKALANRLNEVLLNGYWIANTNYKSELEAVNWQQAVYEFGSLNSIASLTFHINYYLAGLIPVFRGGALEIRDQFSFDLEPIHSETDWQNLRNEFLKNAELFIIEVSNLPDAKLDQTFVKKDYGTYLRNIEGVIEHSYYHLGQITLIKKIMTKAAT